MAVVTAAYAAIQPSSASARPPWTAFLAFQAVVWSPWILFTPLVAAATRLLGSRLRSLPVLLPAHLLLALLIVAANTAFIAAASLVMEGAPLSMEALLVQGGRLALTLLPPHLISYAAVAGLTAAWAQERRIRRRQLRESRLESRLAEARLQALRAQIQPHFLFNTLNSISVLVRRGDLRRADRMISLLGDLLRSGLEESRGQTVPLETELETVRRYLDIEQVRFADRLEVRLEVDPETRRAEVPSLILQPLVENAVRHGVSVKSAPGVITIRAERHDDEVILRVTDDGPGPGAAPRDGVGLSNTRERLQRIYGKGQRLVLRPRPEGGALAELRLPWSAP